MRQKTPGKGKGQDRLTLSIDHIGVQGDGVARCGGKPVYIPKTAPGDVVIAHIRKTRTESLDAALVEILEPSSERQHPPPCPHYATCGGCALQHIAETHYRAFKMRQLETALHRIGIAPSAIDPPVFLAVRTRRRVKLAVRKNKGRLTLGYHAPRAHTLTDIHSCAVLVPELDRLSQNLRPFLSELVPEGVESAVFLQSVEGAVDMVLEGRLWNKNGPSLHQNEQLADMLHTLNIARLSYREEARAAPQTLLARQKPLKTFGPLRVTLPPGAFLQPSAEGEASLTQIVSAYCEQSTSIADLFAGCGTFSGALLQTGTKVTAIEQDKEAAQALASAGQGYKNLRVEIRDLFTNPLTVGELSSFDALVLDPPRAGARAQCANAAQSNLARIIYVSCDLGSFTRDAALLTKGGYALERITLVDQFVWSAHIEIIALFGKK